MWIWGTKKMGLYDELRSSYNLTEEFTNITLQTKDLDSCLSFYWIDTHGKLFLIDKSNTADLEKTGDKFLDFKWTLNGNHGKVSPVIITKYVEVYDNPYKRCKIHFKNGIVQDFEIINLNLDEFL